MAVLLSRCGRQCNRNIPNGARHLEVEWNLGSIKQLAGTQGNRMDNDVRMTWFDIKYLKSSNIRLLSGMRDQDLRINPHQGAYRAVIMDVTRFESNRDGDILLLDIN